jgi:hypothetical protein
MGIYKSAMGKAVDMSSLAAKNETVRAVSNVNVNARGDTVDSTGKVIVPITSKVSNSYSKTVGNKSAHPRPPLPVNVPYVPPIQVDELTMEELELDSASEEEIEIEQTKAKAKKK